MDANTQLRQQMNDLAKLEVGQQIYLKRAHEVSVSLNLDTCQKVAKMFSITGGCPYEHPESLKERLMRKLWENPIAIALGAAIFVIFLFVTLFVYAADAPPQDPLAQCRADLAVTGQYAMGVTRARNGAEQELARANARIAELETQVAASKKKP